MRWPDMKLIEFNNKDKVEHFFVTAAIVFAVAWFINDKVAVLAALTWSFGKEKYDTMHDGIWDWRDIAADLLGIIFALEIII